MKISDIYLPNRLIKGGNADDYMSSDSVDYEEADDQEMEMDGRMCS